MCLTAKDILYMIIVLCSTIVLVTVIICLCICRCKNKLNKKQIKASQRDEEVCALLQYLYSDRIKSISSNVDLEEYKGSKDNMVIIVEQSKHKAKSQK